MLSMIKIYDATLTESIIVNELTGPLRYPVETFDWTDPTRGDDLPKMEEAGQHDRFKDIDSMAINMEGHFLADTTDQYWDIRKALLRIVLPSPLRIYRYHSHIQIKLDGDGETYWCNVNLMDRNTPLQAFYPTVTPFQFQWENPFGYWRKLSDQSVAYI